MNFSFLRLETTKLGPQQIKVESCDASYSPHLAVLSIHRDHYVLLAAVSCCLRPLLPVNFSFLRHETTKLGPQQVTAESGDASYSPHLVVLSIHRDHHVLLAAVSCCLRSLLPVNFSFLRHEMTKLGPQRITVESCDASYSPRLAVLSIHQGHHVLLATISCCLRSLLPVNFSFLCHKTNHGRKLQCKLLTSVSGIVH